jgi:hypothetical protein
VFKSLIIVHLMIREGEPEVTLKYLAQSPQRKLAINSFTEGTASTGHGSRPPLTARHSADPGPQYTDIHRVPAAPRH